MTEDPLAILRDLGIAHDLRGPLRSAAGELQLIMSRPLDESARGGLEATHDHVLRMADLLDDMLALGAPRRATEVDLNSVVAACLVDSGIQADVDELPPVLGNPAYWQRIVQNLIHNAHTHGTPPIRVTFDDGLRIADAGAGLPRDLQVALRDGQPLPRHGVHGLGLELVRTMVQLEGGTLDIEDGGPVIRGCRWKGGYGLRTESHSDE